MIVGGVGKQSMMLGYVLSVFKLKVFLVYANQQIRRLFILETNYLIDILIETDRYYCNFKLMGYFRQDLINFVCTKAPVAPDSVHLCSLGM